MGRQGGGEARSTGEAGVMPGGKGPWFERDAGKEASAAETGTSPINSALSWGTPDSVAGRREKSPRLPREAAAGALARALQRLCRKYSVKSGEYVRFAGGRLTLETPAGAEAWRKDWAKA